MAFIDIHTNNLSRELRNATTYIYSQVLMISEILVVQEVLKVQ